MNRSHLRSVTIVLILAAAAIPSTAALVADDPADAARVINPLEALVTTNLPLKLREHHLQLLDREALVLDAEDGSATLTLYANTPKEQVFQLSLTEKKIAVVYVDALTGREIPLEYAPRFFRGTVEGEPGSSALLTATAAGIDGYVQTAHAYIQFEPLGSFQAAAPANVVVVYDTKDLILSDATHPEPLPNPDLPAGGILAEASGDVGAQHTGRRTDVAMDYSFYMSRDWSSWQSKSQAVAARMDSNFEISAGWSMVGNTLYHEVCVAQACDAAHGMSGADCSATLANFKAHSAKEHTSDPWNFRAYFTARDIPQCLGIAYMPGQYSITQIRNSGRYDGATSNHEAGQVMSQEVGHNLNAQHRHGTVSDHDHGKNHKHETTRCTLPDPPILGICLMSETETTNHWHEDFWVHVDIMKSGYCRDVNDNCGGSDPSRFDDPASKTEWINRFSSAAVSAMDSCNHSQCFG